MDKDYKLAEHLIAHLQQDDVLAPMVCPTVWDEQEQIDAIRRIERDYGLDVLPEKLQSAALLRIANPEASLAALATLSYPPVTKSCLNYRLKKLMEFHMDD